MHKYMNNIQIKDTFMHVMFAFYNEENFLLSNP